MAWLRDLAVSSRWVPWGLVCAVLLSRVLALVFFQYVDVANDSGVAIKPGGYPAYLDYALYRAHMDRAWAAMSRPIDFAQQLLSGSSQALSWLYAQKIAPGPLFPSLLAWTDFEENRALLSGLYLLGGGVLGWTWANWVRQRGGAAWLQWLVACFPALLYYSLLVSTDLLYALVVAAWLSSAWAVLENRRGTWWVCSAAMVLALLTRPNALALVPLMCTLALRSKSIRWPWVWCSLWMLAGLYMFVYYLPYYWVHEGNATSTHYWGTYPAEYYSGLWPQLPAWVSRPLSWLMLFCAKVLHAVGLRPSYSGLGDWLVLARAWPGVLMLPGLIYGLRAGSWFDRWFLFFFMMPVFVGAAQERYLLAVTPLLLLWGVQAWGAVWRGLAKRSLLEG